MIGLYIDSEPLRFFLLWVVAVFKLLGIVWAVFLGNYFYDWFKVKSALKANEIKMKEIRESLARLEAELREGHD